MAAREKDIVTALLGRHGISFSGELGIDLTRNTPSPLFRWLCAAILMSARISSDNAMRGAKALAEAGWTTAEHMADSSREDRVKVLNENGYARYDESTARMLGDDAGTLLDRYGGDLRRLREAAERDPGKERKLLKEFKGIGDVGSDIFCREAQAAWDELHPFADKKALGSAEKLGLPESAERLSKLVTRQDFPRLLSALVRCDLARDHDEVLAAAG